jgi:hypothetical protein
MGWMGVQACAMLRNPSPGSGILKPIHAIRPIRFIPPTCLSS